MSGQSGNVVGILGGSGLYEMEGLTDIERVRVDTPFGAPSDEFLVGRLGDTKMVFLPRHGRGHRILPHEINFRANICAMKQLGVTWLLSVSAVGSMKEDIHPGDIVIVDQFIDRTKARESTFFGDGIAGHVPFADPICADLAGWTYEAAKACGARVHKGGTYVVMEGPMFSTRAESKLYRSWGVDVIGMTNLPEAKLAREAEMSYATIALATDYDCWHETEEDVSVEAVVALLHKNVALAKSIVKKTVELIPAGAKSRYADAARNAIMTSREAMPDETKRRLAPLFGKYLE
ncbi:MAG: S-methyl-5'-thioadenosine phosphorylase [Polyangia bacterium]